MLYITEKGPNNFAGIIFVEQNRALAYDSCDWDGRMSHPYPNVSPGAKAIWIPLHKDKDTKYAFVGERKMSDMGVLLGKLWWE